MGNLQKQADGFFNKFQRKISTVALLSVLASMCMMVAVSYSGISSLYTSTSEELYAGMDAMTEEYLGTYLQMTSETIEGNIKHFFDEQAMMAEIYQTVLDRREEMAPVIGQLEQLPLFRSQLDFNGRWYQNQSSEVTEVLVERYLLDSANQIRPEVKKEIRQSALWNLIMPAFYHHGANKLWIYYTGPKDQEFMRVMPWNNMGANLDIIYPAFTDTPIWEAFNPGLVAAWENRVKEVAAGNRALSELAIMKSPYQDGGSGKSVMTLNHPVWDDSRTQFMGSISIDVELEEIIRYTQNLKLAQTGFAFISQSNGNIFAINSHGEDVMGLKNDKEATVKKASGSEYNPLERFFADSKHASVRELKLPLVFRLTKQEVEIDGVTYILMQKNLRPLSSWSPSRGFYSENWTLGFVVPKHELYAPYYTVRNQVNETGRQIFYQQIAVVALFLALVSIPVNMLADRLTKDLEKLEVAATAIAKADYDAPVEVGSQDEIGSLASAIGGMRDKIKAAIGEMTDKNIKLEQANVNLMELSGRYEEIIGIVTTMMAAKEQTEEVFFAALLSSARKLVPEADFGSITKLENGQWHYMATIGHDRDGLNRLGMKRQYLRECSEVQLLENKSVVERERIPHDIWEEFMQYSQPSCRFLLAPLRVQEDLVGTISLDIQAGSEKRFAEESVKAIHALAHVASAFISLKRYALRLEKIHEIDGAILANQAPKEILQSAMLRLRGLIPCQRISSVIADADENVLSVVTLAENEFQTVPGRIIPLSIEIMESLGSQGVTVANRGNQDEPISEIDRIVFWDEDESYLRAPLEMEGLSVGAVYFISTQANAFTNDQMEIAHEVATTITIALQQARLQEKVYRYNEELEKRIRELEAKNAEMERFTYTVSHDLKSPLITIKGFLGMLVSDAKAGNLQRLESDVGRIVNAADKMQALLEDLLELSRVGRIINPASSFSMTTVAQEAAELLHGAFREKGVMLAIQPDMPVVYGDRVRLREVYQNLLENACKYMGDQKAPIIDVGWNGDVRQPVYYVKDNGIGIESSYHQKIFGLFDKLDPRSEGTGIGLALVKRIIELHGGGIWVESSGAGHGAIFSFTLPRKEEV